MTSYNVLRLLAVLLLYPNLEWQGNVLGAVYCWGGLCARMLCGSLGREIKRLGSQINYELQKGFELVCINMLLNVTFVACVYPVWMFPFYGMVFEHWVWFICVTLLWRIIHWSHDSLVLILCFCTHFLLAPPRNHHLSYIMQLLAMNQICTSSSSMFLIYIYTSKSFFSLSFKYFVAWTKKRKVEDVRRVTFLF